MSEVAIEKEAAKEEVQETGDEAQDNKVNDSTMGGFMICPRCKFDTRNYFVQADEEDRKEYIRSFLGTRNFTKEYSLLDGEFKIMFSDIPSKEADFILNFLSELVNDPTMMSKLLQIKILFGTVYFMRGTQKTEIDRDKVFACKSAKECFDLYDEYFGKIPEALTGMVFKFYNIFCDLIVNVTTGGFDKNFTRGAGSK